MKRLLRSIIDFDSTLPAEALRFNFQRLQNARMEWAQPGDDRIFKFIRAFFQEHLDMPSIATIRDYFTRSDDVEVLERLKIVASAESYSRTNFAYLLQTLREDQAKVRAVALLKEAQDIVVKGLDFQEPGSKEKIRKQGVRDGLVHFSQGAADLISPEYNARVQGDIRLDGAELWEEYQSAKVNKDKVYGKATGLDEIDKVCQGIKKGELWVHAAFPGHLKTTFALNWAYNLSTRYRTNVVYWSLEMPYEQIRRNVIAIHSANLKWAKIHKPLDYRAIRNGELTSEEEDFYKLVLEDWVNNPDYCHFEIKAPDHEVTIDDIKLETELIHKQFEVGFVAIDHGQEVEAQKHKRSKDYVTELNSVVRGAKRMALHFNHGEKVPVLMLFQINRQGHDEAAKNDGVYKMTAINYANQVEKSSDTITTSFLDDARRTAGTVKFCNLKNRDNPIFAPFEASVHFGPRRIHNGVMDSSGPQMGSSGMSVEEQNALLSNL